MTGDPAIREVPSDLPRLHVFRINGKVRAADMEAMAGRVLAAFEAEGKIDMLLVFDRYGGAEFGSGANWTSLKAQAKSLTHVRTYAVAGAPEAAGRMVEGFAALMPVDGRAFPTEAEAMAYLRSLPPLG